MHIPPVGQWKIQLVGVLTIARGGRRYVAEYEKKGKRGRESRAGCKTFLLFLLSLLPACSSRVHAVCPACLRRKHRGEARPEVVETRYNCGSSHPSRHACRTGWLVAASAVHESRLSFSSIFRFPFFPFSPCFLLPLIVVLRRDTV